MGNHSPKERKVTWHRGIRSVYTSEKTNDAFLSLSVAEAALLLLLLLLRHVCVCISGGVHRWRRHCRFSSTTDRQAAALPWRPPIGVLLRQVREFWRFI